MKLPPARSSPTACTWSWPVADLRALVFPSKKVDDRFRSTVVTTTDGKVLTGFLTQKGDDSIALVEPEGQLHILSANKVDEVGISKISPMPEGLLQYLDEGEIDDLLAYLRSL